MSKQSVVGQATQSFTHPFSERSDPKQMTSDPLAWALHPVETGTAWAYLQSQKSDVPNVNKPGAPPTRQNANETALHDQLNNEMNTRNSRTAFGGGVGGILSASQTLLGT